MGRGARGVVGRIGGLCINYKPIISIRKEKRDTDDANLMKVKEKSKEKSRFIMTEKIKRDMYFARR